MKVTGFSAFKRGILITSLNLDGQSTMKNSVTTVDTYGCHPTVTMTFIVPWRLHP